MVKNFGKGGKGCKKMKSGCVDQSNRILLFKEFGQDYAVVKDVYGGGRYSCVCSDGNVVRLGILRGNMRRRSNVRIGKGDLVLVGLRDYQEGKADIMHVYLSDELRTLVNYNEITNEFLQIGVVAFGFNHNGDHEDDISAMDDDIIFG
jgi:translation initiation factor 1A